MDLVAFVTERCLMCCAVPGALGTPPGVAEAAIKFDVLEFVGKA